MSRLRRALRASSVTLIAAGLAASAPAAAHAADTDASDDTRTTKTLVIGIDGAAYDFMAPEEMPNLTALREAGMTSTSNLFAQPMAGTISGAGWSTIATGVWPDKHNVVDNTFASPNYGQYPDYMTRIEAADPDSSTLVVGTWKPISQQVFGPEVDERLAGGNDAGTTAAVVERIANGDPDNVFVHLDEVDGAGHSVGTNGAAYPVALKRADAQIGEMLAAIQNRPTYTSEDWVVVVTSDHGHRPAGGHGGNSAAERKTFVVAAGPGIPAESFRYDVKISDIAPLVLEANGIPIDAAWDLDGVNPSRLTADAFDTVRPQLRTRVDETRPGAEVRGWTHQAPEGWSIDNSRMPEGGVTEWRGWSFATDEFWTAVEGGQMRETSVRNRDVFAVADSDEWDDRSHSPGAFDSTLISPEWPLNGSDTATLSYATNYFIDGPQSAEVLVSFDSAPAVSLKSYRIDTNRIERLEFEVPTGARTAQFSFHYTGTNSAFWTVDQVALTQEEPPAPVLPGAPVDVQASAGDSSITVSWEAPASDAVVTGYTAKATPAAASGDTATLAADGTASAECTTVTTSCVITGLQNGVAYQVSVLAHSADGDSDPAEYGGAVTPIAAGTGTPGEGDPDDDGAGSDGEGEGAGGDGAADDGESSSGDTSADGELATTGVDPLPFLMTGVSILAVGGALTAIGLRRRASAVA